VLAPAGVKRVQWEVSAARILKSQDKKHAVFNLSCLNESQKFTEWKTTKTVSFGCFFFCVSFEKSTFSVRFFFNSRPKNGLELKKRWFYFIIKLKMKKTFFSRRFFNSSQKRNTKRNAKRNGFGGLPVFIFRAILRDSAHFAHVQCSFKGKKKESMLHSVMKGRIVYIYKAPSTLLSQTILLQQRNAHEFTTTNPRAQQNLSLRRWFQPLNR
jgi:hypothetical protein